MRRTQQFRLLRDSHKTVIPTGAAGFFLRAAVWRAGRGVEGPASLFSANLSALRVSALSFLLSQVSPPRPI